MIEDTIRKIEARLQRADSLQPEAKAELLDLLRELKAEMTPLADTHGDDAQSITGFADVSTHEATREGKSPQRMRLSLDGLAASVDGFETSHPKLVQVVNRLCETLSNLGV